MKFVDKNGENVNLEDLEPWCHYMEHDGKITPILCITYSTATNERHASIKVEWEEWDV